jgi:myo-inositol-1(or 4)-monophosphatase
MISSQPEGANPVQDHKLDHKEATMPARSVDFDLLSEEVRKTLVELHPLILANFQKGATQFTKADGSVVTETDKLVNSKLSQLLVDLLPGSFYLGEESADASFGKNDRVMETEYIWSVDEIDGTQNFSLGIPIFGVSIGLLKKEPEGHRLVMGAILMPALDALFFQKGDDVYCQSLSKGESVKLSPSPLPISPHSLVLVPDNYFDYYRLSGDRPIQVPRILGCVVADIMYTATGKSSGTLTDFHIWDFAGSLALAEKLGVEMRSIETGEKKIHYNPDDFVQGEQRMNWCLKEKFIISPAQNFEFLRKLFIPLWEEGSDETVQI